MTETIHVSSTTTSSGMVVNKSYWPSSSGEKFFRVRECIFPEGHHMRETYGLTSLKLTQIRPYYYSCDLKGMILGQEFGEFGTDLSSPAKVRELLASLKRVKGLPITETVMDLLRIGRHVRL